jgi:ArsR family transcriptional regulator, zinc-responsive transcriptional repressor
MAERIGTKLSNTGEALKGGEEPLREPTQGKLTLTTEYLQTVAFLSKSLSDENRLRILHYISGEKKSVSSIVEELNLSQPLVSHHLKELKRSLLVKIERNGPFIYYELSDSRILDVIQTLSTVATDLLTARKTF